MERSSEGRRICYCDRYIDVLFGELVKKFLEETYGVLSENDSFFRKVNIHIIQCDDQVQTDQKITCEEELKEYMDKLELKRRRRNGFQAGILVCG